MTEVKVVNGFNIYPFESKQEFVEYLREEDPRKILIALNAEKLIKTEGDLKTIINENIGFPDGVGAVLALKKKGVKAQKIAGAEFWLNIIEEFYKEKSFYLIGAELEVIEGTIEKLRRKFKGIRIVGYHDGFFEEEGFERILSDIERAKPDVVFVAMGSPKQEFLMNRMKARHSALYMGLGGSFDVYTGKLQRAPQFWIDNNMEWAYRLIKQPKRIVRQVFLVKFLYLLVRGKL